MDMRLLKKAAEKITMQDDMKQRLVEKCQAEGSVETEMYHMVFVDAPVVKPKSRYARYAFACLATIVMIVMLAVTGILLYNGVEMEVGTYAMGTAQCTQIIEDMENAFLETRKTGGGKILIEHSNGSKMEGEVILDDWRLDQGITNCQYYYFSRGSQWYLKKNQGYYNGYYVKKEDQWEEQENPLRSAGYDYTYWISYLLLDFCVPGAWYTTDNLEEVTVIKKGGDIIYLFDYGTYGYRRFVVDKNQVIRKGELLKTDMTVERRCVFEPCEVQQIETPFDENIEALKKTKLDLDADGTLDNVAVEYLENGVKVTVNDTSMTLNYGEEIPAGYYAASMTDMKRFLEQDADTGAVILTMQAADAMNTQFFDYTPRKEPLFCVVGYDGTELYLLGSYEGEVFHALGADGFYVQRYNEETFSYENIDFFYDRENKMLVQTEITE